jgi:type IV pilus assembly protein PilO
MNQFLEEIIQRPVQQRVAILVGAIFVVMLLLWANVISPKSTDYSDLSDKVEGLRMEIQKEKRLAMNRNKFEQEVADLDVQLEVLLHELPDSSEIPELLSSVSGIAKESGLEVETFRVNTEQIEDFYSRFPVELSVAGSYNQVASFLDSVAKLPRIVNISQIEMIEPAAQLGSASLKVNCVATTFRYLTTEEQSKVKAQSAATQRR